MAKNRRRNFAFDFIKNPSLLNSKSDEEYLKFALTLTLSPAGRG
jgi:hypothetical protein